MSNAINPALPDRVRQIIESRPETDREAETEAYRSIAAMIGGAQDEFTKRVYTEAIEFVISEEITFSYCLSQVLESALDEQKEALAALQPFSLFEEIERVISGGIDGIVGSRRWRLWTVATYSKAQKIKKGVKLEGNVLPASFRRSYYDFGSNQFFVGRVVEQIVRMIEQRYDIDFRKLEEARRLKISLDASKH